MSAAATTPHGTYGAVDYEESELFASDPRVPPGLPRPIGWRVRSPDASQAYDKFGPNDTDWIPVGGAAGPWPGNGIANLPVGPSTGGVAATTARSDHQHPMLEVANLAALAALASGTMNNGTFVYVTTLKATFILNATTIATVAGNVVAASGKAASRWCRLYERNPAWEAQTTWFVDPQNAYGTSGDENDGSTSATALTSYAELDRRLAFALITTSRTVTVRSNFTAGDEPIFSFRTLPGVQVTFDGVLSTVVFSGTVTTWTPSSTSAAADDNQLVDATVPASFTASGMLAAGVLFKRTNGADVYWYGAKDLGGAPPAATLRTSDVFTLGGGVGTLVNGDSYTAYSPPTIGAVRFTQILEGGVIFRFLNQVDSVSFIATAARGIVYRHAWHNGAAPINAFACVNLAVDAAAQVNILLANSAQGGVTFSGMMRGTNQTFFVPLNVVCSMGRLTLQGVSILCSGVAFFSGRVTVHDVTGAGQSFIVVQDSARAVFGHITGCFGGKGSSCPIVDVGEGQDAVRAMGEVLVAVATPWVAGSTSNATPILINNRGYTVAQVPLLAGGNGQTNIKGGVNFGWLPVTVVNGAQAVVIGNTGPAAIGTPGAPAGWETFYDQAGVLSYRPFWQ